jgi:hypothetical protein
MRKIQDKFVPYQQSLDMKELGFDEECFAKYYQQDGSDGFIQIGETEIEEAESAGDDITFECEAPLWQDAFRWFREKRGLYGYPFSQSSQTNIWFKYFIQQEWKDQITSDSFNTHEEAELECLKKLIEIVKENK